MLPWFYNRSHGEKWFFICAPLTTHSKGGWLTETQTYRNSISFYFKRNINCIYVCSQGVYGGQFSSPHLSIGDGTQVTRFVWPRPLPHWATFAALFLLEGQRVSCITRIPDWSQTHYRAGEYHELVIPLPVPPERWDYRDAPPFPGYSVLGIKTRLSCALSKHPTHWGTALAFSSSISKRWGERMKWRLQQEMLFIFRQRGMVPEKSFSFHQLN